LRRPKRGCRHSGTGHALKHVTLDKLTQEFYEIFQDYYHHRSELRPGPLFIHEPALAQPKREGWEFEAAGLLEVIDDPPKTRPRKFQPREAEPPIAETTAAPVPTTAPHPHPVEPGEIETFAPEEAASSIITAPEEAAGRVCKSCGSIVEDRYSFCWHCGQAMRPRTRASKPAEGARSSRDNDGHGSFNRSPTSDDPKRQRRSIH
jgi:hypothetical protein